MSSSPTTSETRLVDHGGGFSRRQVRWISPATLGWALLVLVSLAAGFALTQVHPKFVLLAVVGMLGLVILFRAPVLGMLAYLVFEYARLPAMFPILQPLQVGKLIVVATALAWFSGMLVERRVRFVRDRANLFMGLWVLFALLSCVDAIRPDLAWEGTTGLAKFVASYYLIVNLVVNLTQWSWCIWILMLLHMKMSQFQLRLYSQGIQSADDRYQFIRGGVGTGGETGFFGNSTDFGAAMCVIAPLAFYLGRASKSIWLRLLALGSLAAFTLSILRTGSRGAAVALFAMIGVWWLKSPHKLRNGLLIPVLAVGFWFAAPQEWQERFESGLEYSQDVTASSRLKFWKSGLQMLVAHPINGVGLDNFTASYRAMGGDGFVAHSIWIEAASELGLLGFFMVVAVMVMGVRRNAQTRRLCQGDDRESRYIRGMSDALDLSLVGYLVAGTFTSILYYPFIFMTMAFIISLHHIARERAARPDALAFSAS